MSGALPSKTVCWWNAAALMILGVVVSTRVRARVLVYFSTTSCIPIALFNFLSELICVYQSMKKKLDLIVLIKMLFHFSSVCNRVSETFLMYLVEPVFRIKYELKFHRTLGLELRKQILPGLGN